MAKGIMYGKIVDMDKVSDKEIEMLNWVFSDEDKKFNGTTKTDNYDTACYMCDAIERMKKDNGVKGFYEDVDENDHPHWVGYIDVPKFYESNDSGSLPALGFLYMNANKISVYPNDDGTIRMVFGIDNIWEE